MSILLLIFQSSLRVLGGLGCTWSVSVGNFHRLLRAPLMIDLKDHRPKCARFYVQKGSAEVGGFGGITPPLLSKLSVNHLSCWYLFVKLQ